MICGDKHNDNNEVCPGSDPVDRSPLHFVDDLLGRTGRCLRRTGFSLILNGGIALASGALVRPRREDLTSEALWPWEPPAKSPSAGQAGPKPTTADRRYQLRHCPTQENRLRNISGCDAILIQPSSNFSPHNPRNSAPGLVMRCSPRALCRGTNPPRRMTWDQRRGDQYTSHLCS